MYNNPHLDIYKASAGSGKTFTLAVKYIELLVKNPLAYQRILAVTFTNKATEEMKERILSQLHGIAIGDKDSNAYLERIATDLNMSEETVRQRAKEALDMLIHDYSRFQVTTIDSFFQMVMRNLARELGLGAAMNIELDTASVLTHAVDEMIDELNQESEIFKHILAYIKGLIKEDKGWKIIDSIKSFGQNIFNEEFLKEGKELHQKLDSHKVAYEYKELLKKGLNEILRPIEEAYQEFSKILEQTGIAEKDLPKNTKTIVNYFRAMMEKGDYSDDIRKITVVECMNTVDKWQAKKNAILSLETVEKLRQQLCKAETQRAAKINEINSYRLSLEHIDKVALLAAIDQKVHDKNRENNRFMLAETNILLNRMIDQNDSSFVFEKIGTTINHIMIDEFQDTSHLQWENFRILLSNGLSQNHDSLIVGDVKQAIYRWRNGDWSILGNLEKEPLFSNYIRNIAELPTINRRSEENIINFNNAFFWAATQVLNDLYKKEQGKECEELKNAYSDVEQRFNVEHKEPGHGYIKVAFTDKNESYSYEEQNLNWLLEEINRLKEKGVLMKEISILVRKNKFIPLIADYLSKQGIPVISNEAYRLDASQAILTLIVALKVLSNPNDRIAMTQLAALYHQHKEPFEWDNLHKVELKSLLPEAFVTQIKTLRNMPLYELLERLVMVLDLKHFSGQDAYLFTFFDAVTEYLRNGVADIASFIEHWDKHLCKKTIPAAEMEGIHIYSIHNSKGLEFPTVLIPFCSWKMEKEFNTETVWCTPTKAPFNQLNLLPIRYGKMMNQSIYNNAYLKEQLELWVDNLNILYVAFTRAKNNLLILGKKSNKDFSVSQLLQSTLDYCNNKVQNDAETCTTPAYTGEEEQYDTSTEKNRELLTSLRKSEDENIISYEMGEIFPSPQKKEKRTEEKKEENNLLVQKPQSIQVKFESHQRPLVFRQSNRAAEFIRGDEQPDNQELFRQQGIILHQLFSAIRTIDDVDTVLQQMEMEGMILSLLSKEKIQKLVHRALNNPIAKEWFSPKWKLFNERNIVCKNGIKAEDKRPDRVMISEDQSEAIVVDFKFAAPHNDHREQVERYKSLLSSMGYPSVKGYLWYVYTGKIQSV